MAELGTIYRMYDAQGALLYVGQSISFASRFSGHRRDKEWWTEITDIKLEHVAVETLDDVERKAIRNENPKYNVIRFIPGKTNEAMIARKHEKRLKINTSQSFQMTINGNYTVVCEKIDCEFDGQHSLSGCEKNMKFMVADRVAIYLSRGDTPESKKQETHERIANRKKVEFV